MFIKNIIPVLLLIVNTNAIGLPDDVIYNRSRFERATDEEFSTSIKQMEMISRVTNGISLQQGLSKGSITNEELISELLNLGDVKPSDIERIDTKELKKLVEGIQKLSEALSKKKGNDKIEKRLEVSSSLVQTVSTVNKLEEPGKEYHVEVNKIKDSKLVWNDLNKFASLLHTLLTSAKNVENGDLEKIGELYEATDLLNPLKDRISKLIKPPDFTSFEKELNSDVISKTKQNLEHFSTVVVTMNNLEKNKRDLSYDTADDSLIEALENDIQTLAALIDRLWKDLETIHILERLFIYRHYRSGNHDSKIIPGFLSGTSDLAQTLNDLKDSWLQTQLKGQAGNLEKALQLFNNLREKTEAAETSIGTLSDLSFTEMSNIQAQVEFLSQFNQISGVSPGTLKKVIRSSANATAFLPNNYKFDDLNVNMNQLHEQFTSLKELLKLWKTFREDKVVAKLKKIKELTSPKDLDEAKKNLDELKKNKDFQAVLKILKKAEKLLEFTKEKFELKKTAESVLKDYKEMGVYVKQVNAFLGKVESLKQNNDLSDLKSVFKDIDTIEKAIVDKTFGAKMNVDPVIASIESTKSALKELDDTINSMKQAKGSEIDGLVGITDATESSRHIGSATKAVSSMNKFLDLDTSKLDAAVKKLQEDVKVKSSTESQNTLKVLAGLIIQIPKFKQEIKSFKDSVQPITSSKLSDYSEIFEKAKSVKGIARDFLALSFSVGKLAKLVPAEKKLIDEIKNLLLDMDKLCLTYSKYQTVFDDSKNTLDNIDLLFTNLQASMTATKPAPAVPPPAKKTKVPTQEPVVDRQREYYISNRNKEVESETMSPEILDVIFVLCQIIAWPLILLFGMNMIRLCVNKKKKKLRRDFEKRKHKLDKPKDAKEVSNTPAATPAVPTMNRTSKISK